MTKFAEEFRPVAGLSGFKDEDLIDCIEKHFSDELRNLVVSLKIQNASIIPMTWPLFLQQAVKWDNNLRTQKTTNKTEEKKATTSTPRTEKVNELQKLNAEQKKWASEGKCICCGKKYGDKHQCDKGKKKYRGKFDLSDMPRWESVKVVKTPTPPPAPVASTSASPQPVAISASDYAQFMAYRASQNTTSHQTAAVLDTIPEHEEMGFLRGM
jgi:hypothetical protein